MSNFRYLSTHFTKKEPLGGVFSRRVCILSSVSLRGIRVGANLPKENRFLTKQGIIMGWDGSGGGVDPLRSFQGLFACGIFANAKLQRWTI